MRALVCSSWWEVSQTGNWGSSKAGNKALQEYPEQAQNYKAIHQLLGGKDGADTVQMWTRLGYAPEVGPSPRRGLQAHLDKA